MFFIFRINLIKYNNVLRKSIIFYLDLKSNFWLYYKYTNMEQSKYPAFSPLSDKKDNKCHLSNVGRMGIFIVFFYLILIYNGELSMPKTKKESIFFTAITAWMMVYIMTLYNTVLATGSFTNYTFLIAFKGMWIEYIIIGLLAYFVSGHLAKKCAFRVVKPGDRPIFIIFAIQTFTVIWQVTFASVLGVYHGYGITGNFIPDYLVTYCKNFIMAFPIQLIIVGPLARFIFRSIFIKPKKSSIT